MEKNVIKYFAPRVEVLELYTEGVLCQSGGGGDNEIMLPDQNGGNI